MPELALAPSSALQCWTRLRPERAAWEGNAGQGQGALGGLCEGGQGVDQGAEDMGVMSTCEDSGSSANLDPRFAGSHERQWRA